MNEPLKPARSESPASPTTGKSSRLDPQKRKDRKKTILRWFISSSILAG